MKTSEMKMLALIPVIAILVLGSWLMTACDVKEVEELAEGTALLQAEVARQAEVTARLEAQSAQIQSQLELLSLTIQRQAMLRQTQGGEIVPVLEPFNPSWTKDEMVSRIEQCMKGRGVVGYAISEGLLDELVSEMNVGFAPIPEKAALRLAGEILACWAP